MTYICPECGSPIDDDADFCYRCGCKKSKATIHYDDRVGSGVCPRCGAEIHEGEMFCRHCGSPLDVASPIGYDNNTIVAVLLALIPGFFSIYGLGHLVLKEWIRGGMFLAMTAIYWYMRSASGNSILLLFLSVGLFIYQALDIARLIMMRSFRNE